MLFIYNDHEESISGVRSVGGEEDIFFLQILGEFQKPCMGKDEKTHSKCHRDQNVSLLKIGEQFLRSGPWGEEFLENSKNIYRE